MFSRFFPRSPKSSPTPQIQNSIIASYDFHIDYDPDEIGDMPQEFLLGECRGTIEGEFTRAVELAFGGYATVNIESLEFGSIFGTVTLVLVAGISFYEFASKYKDFYDSIVLLRQQLRSFMYSKMRRHFRPRGKPRSVEVTLSSIPLAMAQISPTYTQSDASTAYSNIFFWYLFIMNLLLIGALVALAYRAIVAVYFAAH